MLYQYATHSRKLPVSVWWCVSIWLLLPSACQSICWSTRGQSDEIAICLFGFCLSVLKQGLSLLHPWLAWGSLSRLSLLRVYGPGIRHCTLESPASSVMRFSIYCKLCLVFTCFHSANSCLLPIFWSACSSVFTDLGKCLFVAYKAFNLSPSSFNYENA